MKRKFLLLLGGGLLLAVALLVFCGSSCNKTERELKAYLRGIPALQISRLGNSLLINGEVETPPEMLRITHAANSVNSTSGNGVRVINLARMSESARSRLVQKIQDEIGSTAITVHFLNESILLEGTARHDFEADRTVEIVRILLADSKVPETDGLPLGYRKPAGSAVGSPVWGVVNIVDMLRVAPRGSAFSIRPGKSSH